MKWNEMYYLWEVFAAFFSLTQTRPVSSEQLKAKLCINTKTYTLWLPEAKTHNEIYCTCYISAVENRDGLCFTWHTLFVMEIYPHVCDRSDILMIFSTGDNAVLWPNCLDARGFVISPLSNNLPHTAFMLIYNQTIWWDYHPHNQIRSLWADYHPDGFTVNLRSLLWLCVFGAQYNLHIESLCEWPVVCGEHGRGSVVWLYVCMCCGVLVLLHGLLHIRQRNRHKPCAARVTAKGTEERLYVYIMCL